MGDRWGRSASLLLRGQATKPAESEEFDRPSDFLHRTNHSALSGIDGPEDRCCHLGM